MEKQTLRLGRRKFLVLAGVFVFALGWLCEFFKNHKMAVKRVSMSMHPARFYRKLYSAKGEEKDAG